MNTISTDADREKEVSEVYSEIGQISVHAEHLNWSMGVCVHGVLVNQGLPSEYADVMVAGYNIETMKRVWTSLLKCHYRNDDALSKSSMR